MNKYVFLKIIFLILILLNIISVKNYAVTNSIDDVISGGDSFIKSANTSGVQTIDTEKMKDSSNIIYNMLLSLGIIAAVIIAIILGVQYMLAGAESKAQIKQSMMPFIVGCIIIFSAFGIWKAVVLALK